MFSIFAHVPVFFHSFSMLIPTRRSIIISFPFSFSFSIHTQIGHQSINPAYTSNLVEVPTIYRSHGLGPAPREEKGASEFSLATPARVSGTAHRIRHLSCLAPLLFVFYFFETSCLRARRIRESLHEVEPKMRCCRKCLLYFGLGFKFS